VYKRQIHTRARRVTLIGKVFIAILYVSIHTRARRVTSPYLLWHFLSSCFNPHPRTAGDS